MYEAVVLQKVGLAILGALAAACLALLLLAPQAANAEPSNYCSNVIKVNHGRCYGSYRAVKQTYGWGDQHSVCVWASYGEEGGPFIGAKYVACSAGPEVGVYTQPYSEPVGNMYPAIEDNAAGENRLHGVALT